jgi:hypothetical protein
MTSVEGYWRRKEISQHGHVHVQYEGTVQSSPYLVGSEVEQLDFSLTKEMGDGGLLARIPPPQSSVAFVTSIIPVFR